jgi:hypothetical protein
MSWQAQCDELMATNKVSTAGIFGLDGDRYAASAGFSVCDFFLLLLPIILNIYTCHVGSFYFCQLNSDGIKQLVGGIMATDSLQSGLKVNFETYESIRTREDKYLLFKKGHKVIIASKATAGKIFSTLSTTPI